MPKGWVWAGLIGLLAVLAPGARAESLRVGFVSSLSESGASLGRDLLDGLKLGFKHVGGRLGGIDVEIFEADDGLDPARAVLQALDLVERERVQILTGSATAPVARAVATALAKSPVILIGLVPGPGGLAGPECRSNYFALAPTDDLLVEALARLAQPGRERKLALILPATENGRAEAHRLAPRLAPSATVALEIRAGQILYDEPVARLGQTRPDAVLVLLGGGMGVNFVRAYHAAGLKAKGPLLGPYALFEAPYLAAMGEAGLGARTAAPWSDDLDNPVNRRMLAEFDEEHRRPATSHVALGYDLALLLDLATRAVQGRVSDRTAFQNALARASLNGTRGPLRFANNRHLQAPVFLREVGRDTKGRLINQTRETIAAPAERLVPACPLALLEDAPQASPPKRPQ
ncbi:MAG: ABC transporter substrate-binding protein [Rhodospirillales bacterium]|nr:ABC transporter substrate-binding protein [Rhodospirillales bacterium]